MANDQRGSRTFGPPPRVVGRHERAAREAERRLGVVVSAISLGLFIVAVALTTAQLWDGETPCGSVLNRTGVSDACDGTVGGRTALVVVLFVASMVTAGYSFRLRWGPRWSEPRPEDFETD